MDKILRQVLNSTSLSIFFGVLAVALFIKPKKKDSKIKDVSISGTSLNDSQAQSYADTIYSSFNVIFGFDDLTRIEKTLLPLDNPSFNHVYKKFGIRQNRTLTQWLTEQLSTEEIEPFRKFDLVP